MLMHPQPAKVVLLVHGFRPRKEVLSKFSPPGWTFNTVVDNEFESRRLFVPDLLKEGRSFIWFCDGKSKLHRQRQVQQVRTYGSEDYMAFVLIKETPEQFPRYRQKPKGDEGADITWIVPDNEGPWLEYDRTGQPRGVRGWQV